MTTMSTKRIVIIIIVVLIVFIAFMSFAFKKIQTVDMSVTFSEGPVEDEYLLDIVHELDHYQEIMLTGDIKISEFNILLVNHLEEQAVLWENGASRKVEYQLLDKGIIYGNHYLAYISGDATLILNCDDLLGDAVERAIILSYHYRLNSMSKLNPNEIDYFQSTNEDILIRYDRFQMIESLKEAYLEGTGLEAFGFYYHEWTEDQGRAYFQVIEYDYYDGLKAYLTYKTRLLLDSNYSVESYIDEQKNDYGIYSKAKEYEIIGMLWFLVSEQKSMSLYSQDDMRTDRYKILLDNTPFVTVEDTQEYESYLELYNQYQKALQIETEGMKDIPELNEPLSINLISEVYGNVIQLNDNVYLYQDYKGRDNDRNIIEVDQMIVKVAPYKIEYYMID